ncbi:cadherin-like beta sandwich domain-containing protein [Paenibacillus cymbidii]|uniref:cadherin-like beta sandwich domain-containing protein n=1 Tax=Paenibacillus cymbidii TaxID=1639034 RepID=UPI001081C732|nr:cadherin-like beta sandwich domain-containing protein [Paenibacillus cymbidii]
MNARWKAALARLLIVALVLQPGYLLPGGAVYGAEPGNDSTTTAVYGGDESAIPTSTPTEYGEADPLDPPAQDAPPTGLSRFSLLSDVSDGPTTSLQNYTWEQPTVNIPPPAREMAAMAYDETAKKVVMFGGMGNVAPLDDTWIWDGAAKTWTEMVEGDQHEPIAPHPSARKAAAAAYDPNIGKVLLFGGFDAAGAPLGDTWLWDGLAQTWESLGDMPGGPSARGGAQLAYDGEQLVLFGGYGDSDTSPFGDTWLWDGNSWTDVTPADASDSPPPTFFGGMAFDGQSAVLYGGNLGKVTRTHKGTVVNGSAPSQVMTYYDSSAKLWKWDRVEHKWTEFTWSPITEGPEKLKTFSLSDGTYEYGRWGHAMAYDSVNRRVVTYSGVEEHAYYVWGGTHNFSVYHMYYPINNYNLVYGWTGEEWELAWQGKGGYEVGYAEVVPEHAGQYESWPYSFPLSRIYASMVFDGYNMLLFGGKRKEFELRQYYYPCTTITDTRCHAIANLPEQIVDETWLFGYAPPGAPSIKLNSDPIIAYDPNKVNDTVSVVVNVYGAGGGTISARGIEYRIAVQPDETPNDWTKLPYNGSGSGTGTFTAVLNNPVWQKTYEVRGYATNQTGTSYTEPVTFILEDHPNVHEPDVRFERVGSSILHEKDKKRIVAVGKNMFDLLRKPTSGIDYYLEGADGTPYKLDYNVIDERQLELTWKDDLPLGKYDVYLKHDYFEPFTFLDALELINTSFYKPRNFAKIEVPSTPLPASNEVSKLTLQGPFTESPSAPGVYMLSDTSEPVVINDNVLFKGSRLEVDKTGSVTTISGNGRLYLNGAGTSKVNVPYTLRDGEWTMTSDHFAIDLDSEPAADYLNMNMPIKLKSATFVPGGLRFTGDMQVELQAGKERISDTVPIDTLMLRGNQFELAGTYDLDASFKLGPFDVEKPTLMINSRTGSAVNLMSTSRLSGSALEFKLSMWAVQGRIDSAYYDLSGPTNYGSTGLKVGYMTGQAWGLADRTEISQRFSLRGSVSDTLAPLRKVGDTSIPLLSAEQSEISMASYGLAASGMQKLYGVPLPDTKTTAVADPLTAQLPGFPLPGFTAQGTLNLYGLVQGNAQFYSNAEIGFAGQMKAKIEVPEGIPHVGGATVTNVNVRIDAKGLYGSFTYNDVGVTMTYTFKDETMMYELLLPPPPPPFWVTYLEIMSTVQDYAGFFIMGKRAEVGILSTPTVTFKLTQTAGIAQPADRQTLQGVAARTEAGKLTSRAMETALQAQAHDADGGASYRFPVGRPYTGWITLSGDQQDVTIVAPANATGGAGGTATPAERFYDAATDTTFARVAFAQIGTWELSTKRPSAMRLHELLYVNAAELGMDELAAAWQQLPDRQVTAVTVEESGAYWLEIGSSPGETLLYKPDGRPYKLQTSTSAPDWNAYRGPNDTLYVLLDAAQPGTWLIDGGTSPSAALYKVPPRSTMTDAQEWVDSGLYPTIVKVDNPGLGQAIVDIYGADENTLLYSPGGNPYPLQLDENEPGWNAIYDPALGKLTVLLNGQSIVGDWTVRGSRFAEAVVYTTDRKLKSPGALQAEGEHTFTLELPQAGDYLLELGGATEDTVLTGPDGQAYSLVFDEQSPGRNARLQKAAERTPASPIGSIAHIGTNRPIADPRDTLYVTLPKGASGKWKIQTTERITWAIHQLPPAPAITEAKAAVQPGADNRLGLTWSVANGRPGTTVAVMLTNGEQTWLGPLIAQGLPAAGRTTIDIPASILPGTYRVAFVASSDGGAPLYAMADQAITVSSPVSLPAPGQLAVQSTGNGDVTLTFNSLSQPVTMYRVWVQTDGDMQPVMDVVPEPGQQQQVVVSGLPTEASYTFAVSALADGGAGRPSASPLSATVQATLSVPQPAELTLAAETGGVPVKERSHAAYDDGSEKLLFTSAEQVALRIGSDQNVSVKVSVYGGTPETRSVAAGQSASFSLNDMLGSLPLEERQYRLTVEATNESGDTSRLHRTLIIDRTKPALIATNGNDALGKPKSLTGTVVTDSRMYIAGQTEAGVTLTVYGNMVPLDDKGGFSYYLPLLWQDGEGSKAVKMTAVDDAGNETEYRFEVLRGTEDPIPDRLDALAALVVAGGQLDRVYDVADTTYSYTITPSSGKIKLYAAASHPDSPITVDGVDIAASGYAELDVPTAGRTVQLVVNSSKTYSLQIAGYLPDSTELEQLELHDATGGGQPEALQAPYFSGGSVNYAVYVNHQVAKVTLTPKSLQAVSSIKVNDAATPDGQASAPIDLQVGSNTVTVEVKSADLLNTKTYQVTIVRAGSDNAQLQQLTIGGAEVEWSSAFDANTNEYRIVVPNDATTLTVLAAAEHAQAKLHLDNEIVPGGVEQQVDLTQGKTSLSIEVEAQDGTRNAYKIRIQRQQETPGTPPRLTALELVGSQLDAEFSPYKRSYRTNATYASTAAIAATADDPYAVIKVNGAEPGADGKFAANLAYGANLLKVNVESKDGKSSETYSIAIERKREIVYDDPSPTPTPTPSPGTAGVGGAARTVSVEGEDGDWTVQVQIVRSRTEKGSAVDTLRLDGKKAREIVAKANETGKRTVRVHVADLADDPADERIVTVDAESLRMLAADSLTLEIVLPEGRIVISGQSLAQLGERGEELFFRIVPVQSDEERGDIESRVLSAELVNGEPGVQAEIVGKPARIETNYAGTRTVLVFPLAQLALPQDPAAAQRLLAELAVYIEHSDGEKVLKRGTIQYDKSGNAELAIEIDKFSTFTIVRLRDVAGNGGKEPAPYMDGYPDGTFRPEQPMTRAELAAVLERLRRQAAADTAAPEPDLAAEAYADVAPDHWAAQAIEGAQRRGLMVGDPDGRFRPESFVTRAELATIAARWAGTGGEEAGQEPLPAAFRDAEGHWAARAIAAAKAAGWLLGYPDGSFLPDKALSRAEAVSALNRLLGRAAAAGAGQPSTSRWPDVPNDHWALADITSATGN